MKKLLLTFACAYAISTHAMEPENPTPPQIKMPKLIQGSPAFMECQSLLQNRDNKLIPLLPKLTQRERVQIVRLAKNQFRIDRRRVILSMEMFTMIRIAAAAESHKKTKKSHTRSSSLKSLPNILEDSEKTGLIVATLKYALRSGAWEKIADQQENDESSADVFKCCVEYIKDREHDTIPSDLLLCLNPHQHEQIKFLVKHQNWLNERSTEQAMYYEATKAINSKDSAAEQEEVLNQLSLLPNIRTWERLNRSVVMRAGLAHDLKKLSPLPNSDSDSKESSTESM